VVDLGEFINQDNWDRQAFGHDVGGGSGSTEWAGEHCVNAEFGAKVGDGSCVESAVGCEW